ncbi:MAG: hypothetical protein HYR56_25000 [Acidobacteria bacterium]|nr:hypothetical protein [Acidobacteriota bacterium]MBI3424118.1 hypothetical protein [Acidobacteriota bacterium]
MARRIEDECAYCAEKINPHTAVIGHDWKVYCSTACAQRGEDLSVREATQLMQHVSERHWPKTLHT